MKRATGLLIAVALLSSAPSDAHACGGCFHSPNPMGTVSVVSAHRMAFLSSTSESVLWDQVQYTGNPEDFAWVLPVLGNPTVEVADNGFFEALVGETTITMRGPAPPPTFCADPCSPWSAGFGGASASTPRDGFFDAGTGVTVLHQGVAGPYETATISSTDPNALVTWLHDHGYQIGDEIAPTIAYYVGLGMNFVALRLSPQAGIDRMVPVRIRTPGLSLTLPLRMIAAGIGSSVDIELFVFAEGRMETASFPNAEVDRGAISYNWSTQTFDYDAQFDAALFQGSGVLTNWVTEYAKQPVLSSLAAFRSGSGADRHSAMDDIDIISRAIPEAYLTRLRTRLTPAELGADLTLRVANAEDIDTFINVTRERHRAPDPICDTFCDTGDGMELGGSSVRSTGRSYRCNASLGDRRPAGSLLVLATIALGLALARRRIS